MIDGAKVQKIGEICKKNDKYFTIDKYDLIDGNYDNLDNFFLAALLPMATCLSPVNVVFVVIVVVKIMPPLVVSSYNFIEGDS